MEKLWTTTEVANFLGITESDVERLVKSGQLTGYKLGGRFLRFRPEQVHGIKDSIKPRSAQTLAVSVKEANLKERIRDFFYFYDFYIVSVVLLVALIFYLLQAGS